MYLPIFFQLLIYFSADELFLRMSTKAEIHFVKRTHTILDLFLTHFRVYG